MAQLFDARGNEFQGQLDGINGLTLTDARTSTNTLNSLNASVSVDIVGKSTLYVHLNVTVAFNAATTIQVQGTLDGTNFFTVPHLIVQNSNATPTINIPETIQNSVPGATLTGQYMLCASATGFRQMRVIMNTFTTAGTAVVALRATSADYRIISQPYPSLLTTTGTGTSASTTAAFCTIPAGGTGLYTYITSLSIHQFVGGTAVTAAAATTISVTNWGATAATARWGFPNAGAIGTFIWIYSAEYSNPIRSFNSNVTMAFNFTATIAANASCVITANYYYGA